MNLNAKRIPLCQLIAIAAKITTYTQIILQQEDDLLLIFALFSWIITPLSVSIS